MVDLPLRAFYPALPQAESGCAANCAMATPAMVMAAPASLSGVNTSPSVSQATTPAMGGMRYWNGAQRARPRTLFTQLHASQPKNDEMTMVKNRPNATAPVIAPGGRDRKEKKLATTSGGEPMNNVYARTMRGP